MPLVVLGVSTVRKTIMVAAGMLASAWLQTPTAFAQRVGHVGGVAHFRTAPRVAAPHIVTAPGSRAMFLRPHLGLPGRAPLIFRRPFFNYANFAPFFSLWEAFDSSWWLYCGPMWGSEFGCDDLFSSRYAFEHYLPPPMTYNTSVYVYSQDERQPLAQLFLKDGTVYNVNDYWFVDGQIHFTMLDESGTKSIEQVISSEELDLQKTIDVNTRRGFRVVMRDEPLEQYLRDHPDLTPPLLQPPPKN